MRTSVPNSTLVEAAALGGIYPILQTHIRADGKNEYKFVFDPTTPEMWPQGLSQTDVILVVRCRTCRQYVVIAGPYKGAQLDMKCSGGKHTVYI